jgi:DNA-binding MarR family transcriptional regulator
MASSTNRRVLSQAVAGIVRQIGLRYGLYQQALADAVDMHPTDIAAVLAIEAAGSLTPGDLADALGLTSGAVTGVVDRLISVGAVQRTADPQDRRRVLISSAGDTSDAVVFSARLADELASRLGKSDPQEALRVLEAVQDALATQISALRGESREVGALDELTVSAPTGGVTRARLEISPSTAAIVIDTLAARGDLFRAQFTRDRPSVSVSEGSVVMRFASRALEGRLAAISLASSPSWSLRIRGGHAKVRANLSEIALRRLTLMRGRNDVDVALPKATRQTPVRVNGGQGQINLRIPDSAPVQIVSRGDGNVVIVKDKRIVTTSEHRWATSDFDEERPGYSVWLLGGTNKLTVTR